MVLFSIAINFIYTLGIFPVEGNPGRDLNSSNVLQTITGLQGGMENLWAIVTTIGGIAAVTLAILTRSMIPAGIYLFGTVFWTSWLKTSSILSLGGYIPGGFLAMFTVGVTFLFIAAVIGMITGGG